MKVKGQSVLISRKNTEAEEEKLTKMLKEKPTTTLNAKIKILWTCVFCNEIS